MDIDSCVLLAQEASIVAIAIVAACLNNFFIIYWTKIPLLKGSKNRVIYKLSVKNYVFLSPFESLVVVAKKILFIFGL